jgi:hypothetical protein
MSAVGIEPTTYGLKVPQQTLENKGFPACGCAKDSAVEPFAAQCDPRREKIIALLPTLPQAVLDAILRLARQGKPSRTDRR